MSSLSSIQQVEAQENEPAATILGVEFETLYSLSFDDSVELFRRIDEQYRQLPPRNFFAETREGFQRDLENWYRVLLPAFTLERLNSSLYPPEEIAVEDFGFPDDRYYLGETRCESNEVLFNRRFANPFDPMSEGYAALWVVAHEAAHQAARICFQYLYNDIAYTSHSSPEENRRIVESTASLFALEALASLIKEGSTPALYAFLYGLRETSLANVVHRAIEQHRIEELEEAVRNATPDPTIHAYVTDTLMGVEGNSFALLSLLNVSDAYGGRVIDSLIFAAADENFETNRVVVYNEETGYLANQEVAFDDTLYVLEHIADFVHRVQEDVPR